MLYVTGVFALNLPCSLDTAGDWHTSSLNWNNVQLADSSTSILGTWGIEPLPHMQIQQLGAAHYVANTLRALADLIADSKFSIAQGARDGFIANSKYHAEFFEHITVLKGLSTWSNIDAFMSKEFKREWWVWNSGR